MMTSTYSLPWSRDSALDEEEENEYSNPASCESNVGGNAVVSSSSPSSSCPDYEEVVDDNRMIRTSNSRGGLVYNLASENVFRAATYHKAPPPSSTSSPGNNNSKTSSGFGDLEETLGMVGTEARSKIMQSSVYCIHKVRGLAVSSFREALFKT